MRSPLDRSAPRAPAAAAAPGFDADTPVAGHYRARLRSGGVYVGIKVWHGPPLDPVTGEELDRSLRWQALANGAPIALERVWPDCADDPIDEAEYRYLCARQQWAEQNAPDTGFADASRRVDLLSPDTPLPF